MSTENQIAPAPAWMQKQLDEHVDTARALTQLLPVVDRVAQLLCEAFSVRGVLWTFGNGGSAADAQHFTGEIIGHYQRDRPPLPAVTLSTDPTTMTCIANDFSYADAFARQVEALARPQDVVCAFSTSGNSPSVVSALQAARRRRATTVLFGGKDGGAASHHADHALIAPSVQTARIQEMHTLMLHMISEKVDVWAAGTEPAA